MPIRHAALALRNESNQALGDAEFLSDLGLPVSAKQHFAGLSE